MNFFNFNRLCLSQSNVAMVLPTRKQINFAHEYLVDFNATKAAIRAGYSPKSARAIGHELLKKPMVDGIIFGSQLIREKEFKIKHASIVAELKKIAFADFSVLLDRNGKIKPPQEWTADMLDLVESFKVVQHYSGRGENRKLERTTITVKMKDKLKALDLLAKHVRKDRA